MKLHCTKCAYITNTSNGAVSHVQANPTHVVTGPGKDEDTTITISTEYIEEED